MNILDSFGMSKTEFGGYDGTFFGSGEKLNVTSPIDDTRIGDIAQTTLEDYAKIYSTANDAFLKWRMRPAPQRGEVIREIGMALRKYKSELAQLITIEMGKIISEAEGEVQEMIDMADLATGMSRQLCGITTHSERPTHRLYEQWHPLGVIGIISAFNFPAAVWSWNAFVAAICGNTMIWKPSPETPFTALAIHKIIHPVLEKHDALGIMNLAMGPVDTIGEAMIADKNLPLISATGSCKMGKRVNEVVGKRLGKSILELGGNNALIVMADAKQNLALSATLFGAVGTAGQRCTTTRRLLIHETIYDDFLSKLVNAFEQLKIGHPLDRQTHVGPVINNNTLTQMQASIKTAVTQGGKLLVGGSPLSNAPGECYISPAIIEAPRPLPIMQTETFAPLLYVLKFSDLDTAIKIQNDVPQGLSSSIFTSSMYHAEHFLSHKGSDCGIANVNAGTSGAEIGLGFGGEKETGGGREAGSDSWKAYMRRQTNTINWGQDLPLAQGIEFNL